MFPTNLESNTERNNSTQKNEHPGKLTAGSPKNHPFTKEIHLNQTSMILFHVNYQGCRRIRWKFVFFLFFFSPKFNGNKINIAEEKKRKTHLQTKNDAWKKIQILVSMCVVSFGDVLTLLARWFHVKEYEITQVYTVYSMLSIIIV